MPQLDPAIRRVWRLVGALVAAPLPAAGVVVMIVSSGGIVGWIALAVGLLALGLGAGLVPSLRYRHFQWSFERGVLRVAHGVVFRNEATIPVFRIQHIDLEQGPLERWMGVQQLTVHTAAPAADVTLPGISSREAPALRSRLLEESRAAVARFRMGDVSDAV